MLEPIHMKAQSHQSRTVNPCMLKVCVCVGGGGGGDFRPPSPSPVYVRAMTCSKATSSQTTD